MTQPIEPPRAPSAEVPIFPLGQVVLFPRAFLPLHVFEARYRVMLQACLDGDGRMIVAMIPSEHDLDSYGNPKITEIAGVGRVVEHQTLADGRSNILLQGIERVRVDELPFVAPYRRARVTSLTEGEAALSPDDHTAMVAAVSAFTAEVRRRDPSFDFRLPAEAPHATLIDLAAQHLLAHPQVRQAALEELDVARRAELVMRELAVQQRTLLGASGGVLH